MINKSAFKAKVEKQGSIVAIRVTGDGSCLWLNMYLDTAECQMTCDSDIGSYAYHWGKESAKFDFVNFCLCWLANEEWLLRKCVGKQGIPLSFWQKRFAEICREIIVPALKQFCECGGE